MKLNFHALPFAALFALAIPLIIFYFLKLKRPYLKVASLALWQKVIEDKRVNSPFQKFKRNLLLLLQLLVLALLVLATMRPFLRTPQVSMQNRPIVIDTSASMKAVDKSTGKTRLQVCKEKVRKIIDNINGEQKISLITFADSARSITDFSDNKKVLYKALARIEATDYSSDLSNVMQLLQGIYQTQPFNEVILYSDGNIPSKTSVDLSFNINYQLLEPASGNAGIVMLNAQQTSSGEWQLFVSIGSSFVAPTNIQVSLYDKDELLDTQELTLDKSSNGSIFFNLENQEAVLLKVKLSSLEFDSLACDNESYIFIPKKRQLSVYISPDLHAFKHALNGFSPLLLSSKLGEQNNFDLAIFNSEEEARKINAPITLGCSYIPTSLKELLGSKKGSSTIIDWRKDSMLLNNVQLKGITIVENVFAAKRGDDSKLEELNYEVICSGNDGPLMLRKFNDLQTAYHLLFHPDNSTFYYKVSFPVMVDNLVSIALDRAGIYKIEATKSGVISSKDLPVKSRCEVRKPDGEKLILTSDDDGNLIGISADQCGIYSIVSDSQKREIGVSLLSQSESSMHRTKEIVFNEELAVSATSKEIKTDKPLWSILAMIALVFLVVEWWYYQRKSC